MVTFARCPPQCPCSPWLPRACHRHGDWAIPEWLAQAADSLKVAVFSRTPFGRSETRAKSPTENRTTKRGIGERQEADTQTPSIQCTFAESYSPLWASTATSSLAGTEEDRKVSYRNSQDRSVRFQVILKVMVIVIGQVTKFQDDPPAVAR